MEMIDKQSELNVVRKGSLRKKMIEYQFNFNRLYH